MDHCSCHHHITAVQLPDALIQVREELPPETVILSEACSHIEHAVVLTKFEENLGVSLTFIY